MSADNWTKCPKCLAKSRKSLQAAKKKHMDSYGKIDPDDWIRRLAKLNADEKEVERSDEPSFREDYQLGVQEDGSFYVSYSGSCRACNAVFEFKHEIEEAIRLA